MNQRPGALSRTSYRTPRGGVRMKHGGYLYFQTSTGPHGERYLKCANYKEGCKGRIKKTAQGEKIVSKPHTCRKGSKPPQATGSRPRARPATNARQPKPAAPRAPRGVNRVQNPPPDPQESPFRPIRPEPRAGPSHEPSGSEDDDVSMNGSFDDEQQPQLVPLKVQYLTQKMEIGELMKRKLELEIRNLERANPGPAVPVTSATAAAPHTSQTTVTAGSRLHPRTVHFSNN